MSVRAIIICSLCFICVGLTPVQADTLTLLTGEKLDGKIQVVEGKVVIELPGRSVVLPKAVLSEEDQLKYFPGDPVLKVATELPPFTPKGALQPMDRSGLILSKGLIPTFRLGKNAWALFAPHLPGPPESHKGKYPLIIFIHGGGETDANLPEAELMWRFEGAMQPQWQSKYGPTFLMMGIIYLPPVIPPQDTPSDQAKALHTNIQDVLRQFPEIDTSRIYLVSFSLGSRLLMEYVLRTGIPAAAVIHSDSIRRPELASALAEATKGNFRPPIGFYFSPVDSLSSPEKIETSERWLAKNGFPTPFLLPTPIDRHVYIQWSSADDKLWKWLLSFRHPKGLQYDKLPDLPTTNVPFQP
jgi:hypothetical protein